MLDVSDTKADGCACSADQRRESLTRPAQPEWDKEVLQDEGEHEHPACFNTLPTTILGPKDFLLPC